MTGARQRDISSHPLGEFDTFVSVMSRKRGFVVANMVPQDRTYWGVRLRGLDARTSKRTRHFGKRTGLQKFGPIEGVCAAARTGHTHNGETEAATLIIHLVSNDLA